MGHLSSHSFERGMTTLFPRPVDGVAAWRLL